MSDAPFKPSWAKYEGDANNQTDAKKALAASDMFEKEREKEMRTSKKARDWELSRKASILKEKPKWAKQQRLEEHLEVQSALKKFKQGGYLDSDLTPMPGYILVQLERLEKETQSGIILPDPADNEPNTALVIKTSDMVNPKDLTKVPCPIQVGQRILFKKFAGSFGTGLELTIRGDEFRLMRVSFDPMQSDVLGVLE